MSAALAIAILLPIAAPQSVLTSSAAWGGAGPFSITADRLRALPEQGLFEAEGEVLLERGELLVRADRMRFDRLNRKLVAEGGVLVIEPSGVARCRRVELSVPELLGVLEGAELELMGAQGGPGSLGRARLVARGERLSRTERKVFELQGGSVTACDCGEDHAPLWRIDAQRASVDLESGAWLSWPVFYAKDVPFFALPAFYVPLGERRTGLLMPKLSGLGNAVTGLRITEPLYLALSELADATLEPGFMERRGPTLGAELRYAARQDRRGALHLFSFLDYGAIADGVYGLHRADPLLRWSLGFHGEHTVPGVRGRAELSLFGDAALSSELSDAFLVRQAEQSSSRLTLLVGDSPRVRAAIGLQILEELRPDRLRRYDPASGLLVVQDLREVPLLSGQLSGGPVISGPGAVRQRLFTLRMDAPPAPLSQGLSLLGEARLVVDGFLAPRPEVPRFVRADFRPELSLPLAGGPVRFEPALALRLTGWAGHAAGADQGDGRLAVVARARLGSELGRRYGSLVHLIQPELSAVLIPYVSVARGASFANGDEIDQLARAFQVSARLSSSLLAHGSGQRLVGLELWAGRDLGIGDSPGRGNAELVGKLDAGFPLAEGAVALGLDLRGAWSVQRRALAELSAGAVLSSPHGLSVSARYVDIPSEVPTNSLVGSEELVPSSLIAPERYLPLADYQQRVARGELDLVPWTAFRGVALGVELRPARGLVLGFEAVLSFLDGDDKSVVRNTRASLHWTACDCVDFGVVVSTDRNQPEGWLGIRGLAIQPMLEISRLGETVADGR